MSTPSFELGPYCSKLSYHLASLAFIEPERKIRARTILLFIDALNSAKNNNTQELTINYSTLPVHMISRAETITNLMNNALIQIKNDDKEKLRFFLKNKELLESKNVFTQFRSKELYGVKQDFEDDVIDRFRALYDNSLPEFPEDDIKELHAVVPLDRLIIVPQIDWVIRKKELFLQLFKTNGLPRYAFVMYLGPIYNYCEYKNPESVLKHVTTVDTLHLVLENREQVKKWSELKWDEERIILQLKNPPPVKKEYTNKKRAEKDQQLEKKIDWDEEVIKALNTVGITRDYLLQQSKNRQKIFTQYGLNFISFIEAGVPLEKIKKRSNNGLKLLGREATFVLKHLKKKKSLDTYKKQEK